MIRKVRNDFAHSFDDAELSQPCHKTRLSKPYSEARKNPLWKPLEELLSGHTEIDVDLREYMLLVITLVSFMEACAHGQGKFVPSVTLRFSIPA